jgi:hypothetical protein
MALSIDGTGNGTIGNLSVTTETGNILSTASTVAPKVPAFRARQLDAVGQALNTDVVTKILFATEDFDTASFYDTSTSRFTPTVAGYYFLTTSIRGNTPGHCRFDCNFFIDGSVSIYGGGLDNSGDRNIQCYGSALMYLDGTQYVEVYAEQNSGANTVVRAVDNAGGTNSITYFQGFLVHPT